MFVGLSSLYAQERLDTTDISDSLDIRNHDSILLERINCEEYMFHKRIATIDSSAFDKKEISRQLRINYTDYRRWRFGVNGGVGLIIAADPINMSDELLKYNKSLKSGSRFGADATFFISPNIGVGINYILFNTSNRTNHISYEINGNQYEGERQDMVNIHFAGPSISIRSIPRNNKLYTSCDFMLGYFIYTNDFRLSNGRYNLREENFGFTTSIGADYMVRKNLSMGLALNITAASIKNVEILNGNNVENLSRISLVMTLKAYK
jgi:hypothetical protein